MISLGDPTANTFRFPYSARGKTGTPRKADQLVPKWKKQCLELRAKLVALVLYDEQQSAANSMRCKFNAFELFGACICAPSILSYRFSEAGVLGRWVNNCHEEESQVGQRSCQLKGT